MSAVLCMLIGGPEYRIKIGATVYHFELNPSCGPMPIYSDGRQRELDAKHEFWDAVTLWSQQGARSSNGRAIWESEEAWRQRKERERIAALPRAKVIKFKKR